MGKFVFALPWKWAKKNWANRVSKNNLSPNDTSARSGLADLPLKVRFGIW